MDFVKLFAEVGGLSVFIFAAVAQLKQFGLAGKWLTGSAYFVGLLVGGSYRYFVYTPTLPLDWFYLVMFGAAGGFIATGVYKGAENVTKPQNITLNNPVVLGSPEQITKPVPWSNAPTPLGEATSVNTIGSLSQALGEAIDRENRKPS